MGLKTREEYIERLREMRPKVYMFGEHVENPVDHPIIRPSLHSAAMTYELAQQEEYLDLMTTRSPFTDKPINRFCHICTSREDLVNKIKMQRLLGQKTGADFQRSAGTDALNAIYSTTYEMDQEYDTMYYSRFYDYVGYIQRNDLIIHAAVTDPKGDQGLSPLKQEDPDMFLRIREMLKTGITVCGAKVHQSGVVNAHEILVLPSTALSDDEAEYAVCFSIPVDAPGVKIIYGRQSCDTRRLENGADIDLGNAEFGGHEALIVFDNVFVPNDRVFMCRETEYAKVLSDRFSAYRAQSCAANVGVGDVLIGAAALAAEHKGSEEQAHVREKLANMIRWNETIWASAMACSYEGTATESGCYVPDPLLANVCAQNAASFPYQISAMAEEIAGAWVTTMPSQADFEDEYVGAYLKKYFSGKSGVDTEERFRILRLLENLIFGPGAIAYRSKFLHIANSSQTQQVIAHRGDLDAKKELAKNLAHVRATGDGASSH